MKYTERYNARGLEKLKEYEAANGIYHVGDLWRFRKEDNALIAMFNYEEKDLRDEKADFSAVIDEARRHGYNVDEFFLLAQLVIIRNGYKQSRFLPDRSGKVFSPICDNGVVFEFSAIAENDSEYIA